MSLTLLGCTGERSSAVLDPLVVDVAGCTAIDSASVCEVDGQELVLWVEGEDPVLVRGGESVRTKVDNGWQIRVRPAHREGKIAVHRGLRSRTIRLRPYHVPGSIEAVRNARAQGAVSEALAILERFTPSDDRERGLAEGLHARLAFGRGDHEACERHYSRSIPLLRSAGRLSEMADDSLARAYVLHHGLGRMRDAREALNALERELGRSSIREAQLSLHRGTLLYAAGDLRGALREFDRTERVARRLDLLVQWAGAVELRADALQRLGRSEDAERTMLDLEPRMASAEPCVRATYLTNLGWQRLNGARSEADVRSGRSALEQAAEIYAVGCHRPSMAANVFINIATAALMLDRIDEAREALATARSLDANDATIRAWSLDLEGELALRRGDALGALEKYDELSLRAARAELARSSWRGELGRGRALEALGRTDEAAAAYRAAESVLDEIARRAPIDGTLHFSAFEQGVSAEALVALEIRLDHPREALDAARRARRRAVAATYRRDRIGDLSEERRAGWDAAMESYWARREQLRAASESSWTIPADRVEEHDAAVSDAKVELTRALDRAYEVLGESEGLPELTRGALTLVLFPIAGRAWMPASQLAVIASSARGTLARIVEHEDDIASAIAPLWDERAQVRVLAHGAALAIDVHALEWQGTLLGARHSIVYALDHDSAPAAASGQLFGIVGDPNEDLLGARVEVRRLDADLRARGRSTRLLLGSEATHRAAIGLLETASSFYYAGHGISSGGLWSSALPLAEGEALSAADVLALRHVPARVFLIGCGTGGVARAGMRINMAQAFLAAGSQWVVGTTREVGDAAARSFGTLLSDGDESTLLRRISESLAEGDPTFLHFRVWVP